jgi:hypothetical protein
MLLRRLLAVLLAVGLVLAAVQIRARLFADGPDPAVLDGLRVVCVEELASVCDEALQPIGVAPVGQEAAATVARFADREPGIDVWVTFEPWPELAANVRDGAGLPELTSVSSAVLARSPVLLAAQRDRLAALEQACGGDVTWRCIGDRSGDPWSDLDAPAGWGDVDVAFNRPTDTAEGLLTLVQVTSSNFDGGPVTSRAVGTPEYFAWLAELGRSAKQVSGQTPLDRMLVTGAADVEFTGVIEGAARPKLRSASSSAERIELREPTPTVTADVRAVGYGAAGEASVETIAAQVSDALADAGWQRVDAASSESEAAGTAGLDTPSPAALELLRTTWRDVSRG